MKQLSILLTFLSLQGYLRAQDDLLRHWAAYRGTHLYEKVFVQTDKDYYLCGELCWFKCYDVSAANRKPLSLSRVAYVEILDARGKPALQAKISLDAGSGAGSLYLPSTLASGVYTLRAYTRWMRNEPASYYFEKNISVINTRQALPAPPAKTPPAPRVAFFPEGGNLVDGIPSTIAFQATDAYGDPLDVTGVLIDDRGDTLQRVSPRAQGMGRFELTPQAGRRYRVRIGDTTLALPDAYAQGYVLHLDTAADGRLRIAVRSTNAGRVFLLVHSNASMEVAEAAPLTDGQATFYVDPAKLEAGIAHLTVFNDDRQPVCERLWFKQPGDDHGLRLETDKLHYNTRSGVSVHVGAPAGLTGTDLSVAAYRLDSLQSVPEQNIYNYLWLTSDLGGLVSHPGYYFDHPEALDNLLLTRGWRRFRWEDVLKDTTPVFTYAPEYNGHLVTGRVVDTRSGAPGVNMEAYCSAPGNRTLFQTAISDSSGRVAFNFPDMFGTSQIVVQTNLATLDSFYRIDVDNPFSEIYPAYPLPAFAPPLDNPVTLTEHSLSMQVQNAYAAMRSQSPFLPPAADTTAFYLHPDLTYMLDDYVRFTTMEEVLREYVQLVNVYRKGEHFHLWAYNGPAAQPFDEDPFILLDGVPIFNTDQFMKYDPLKLRRLEVLTRRYFLGGVFFTGLLNWTTYRGDLNGYQLDPHATALDYEGLQAKRTFYSPTYATNAQKASRLPDYRNVLYWDPQVSLPEKGDGVVRFFTSDLPGKYVLVVQGISAQGTPLYGETTFEVQGAE
ncbi:MAG TPA: hypothetical protein VL547_08715 [Dinghuibacter sp.]|uniref:hypothetical protein n=1 Tax=Dinghuibacter sp. TaxID=2024697 RepID=UPI002CA070B2|nr:hypothetical protein [Dinghuibacter sp.]HTJ12094.1 hypothetical protein [Dinghuibacter sp.]